MRKRTLRHRAFLNHPASDCLAVFGWRIDVEQTLSWLSDMDALCDDDKDGKKKRAKEWCVSADMNISKEARNHYINRKADMKAVYRMQKELNLFITECEKAFKDVEKANAKS